MFNRLKSIMVMFALTSFMGAAFFAGAPSALAQVSQQGTVTGSVVDNVGPVAGASIIIKGTTTGTITLDDGTFSLPGVRTGSTLVISSIGYKDAEVVWNGGQVYVTLEQDNELLNEVVVTALGISREKKSLGYAVQDVKADQIARSGTATLTDALQGKVAGLQINDSGTGAGGSTRIVLRGNSSLSDNNEPLYVIDGVPYDTGGHDIDAQAGLWGGTDRAGGAFDINPEDIESVSVLKGPTAAALYGSRAGNGVILITTKKGGRTEGKVGVTYSGKFSWSPVSYYLDLQDTWGQGENGAYVATSENSWGARMSSSTMVPAWYDSSVKVPYSGTKNPYTKYYRTGNMQSNNVTIQGGNAENPFRLTIGHDDTQSIVRPTRLDKTSIDFVSSNKVNRWLSLDVKANYVKTIGNNRQTRGLYGATYLINKIPRSIDLNSLKEHEFDTSRPGEFIEDNYYGPDAEHQNIYFVQDQFNNKDVQNKFFGMAAVNINFTKDLKLRVKEGYDWTDYTVKYSWPYPDPVFTGHYPGVEESKYSRIEENTEALLSWNHKYGDFDLGLSAGGNMMRYHYDGMWAEGRSIALQGAQFIAAGSTIHANNSLSEKQINSVYGFANLGYKDWLFLDVTARNDWSSTLPKDNRSYFYPSVSVSALLTGAADAYGLTYNKDVIDYGKIRFSWAKVGKDTDPYQLQNTYSTTTGANGYLYIEQPVTMANAELKPEMSDSFEVGTEWHFFKNRLGLDLTYYHTATKNQIMSVDMNYASGVQKKYINAGKITNQGLELSLNGDFIRTRDWNFGATVNLAKNWNKVNTLTEGIKMYELGHMTGSAGIYVYAIEGESLGKIYGYKYRLDKDGNKIIGSDGLPLRDASQEIGDINPNFTGSFSLNLSYKNLGLNALFAFQNGGDIFSVSEYSAARLGTAKRTENRDNMVIKGVTESGTANTTSVSAQNYWNNSVDEEFIYNAGFLKLSELSLTYNLSHDFVDRLTKGILDSARFSVYGSNLFYLVKHTPGTTPDGSLTDTSIYASAFDMCPYPGTRNFGVSLTLGF